MESKRGIFVLISCFLVVFGLNWSSGLENYNFTNVSNCELPKILTLWDEIFIEDSSGMGVIGDGGSPCENFVVYKSSGEGVWSLIRSNNSENITLKGYYVRSSYALALEEVIANKTYHEVVVELDNLNINAGLYGIYSINIDGSDAENLYNEVFKVKNTNPFSLLNSRYRATDSGSVEWWEALVDDEWDIRRFEYKYPTIIAEEPLVEEIPEVLPNLTEETPPVDQESGLEENSNEESSFMEGFFGFFEGLFSNKWVLIGSGGVVLLFIVGFVVYFFKSKKSRTQNRQQNVSAVYNYLQNLKSSSPKSIQKPKTESKTPSKVVTPQKTDLKSPVDVSKLPKKRGWMNDRSF